MLTLPRSTGLEDKTKVSRENSRKNSNISVHFCIPTVHLRDVCHGGRRAALRLDRHRTPLPRSRQPESERLVSCLQLARPTGYVGSRRCQG
jgi:hypothetical protein